MKKNLAILAFRSLGWAWYGETHITSKLACL